MNLTANLYFFITQLLLCNFLFSHPNIHNNKNIFKIAQNDVSDIKGANLETLTEVLRGAGLNFEDAVKASQSFKNAYPPERLSEKSYLIMPPLGKKINAFAVNVDDVEAVLIIRSNNIFVTYITSLSEAKRIVSKDSGGLSNIDSILPLEVNQEIEKISTENYIETEFAFYKGSTLFGLLYSNINNKKEIREAVAQLKKIIDPTKISIGAKGKIFKTKESKLLGFYIQIDREKYITVFDSVTGYTAEVLDTTRLNNEIKKKFIKASKSYIKLNKTRISLFNNTDLEVLSLEIRKGSNLYLTLQKNNISNKDIYKILKKIEKFYNLRKIKAGKKIKVIFLKEKFYGFSIKLDNIKELQLIKLNNDLEIYLYERSYRKVSAYSRIIIDSNLYLDAKKAKLPNEIFIDMVKLLSYSIDFQRDIRPSTVFEVLYENLYDYKNEFIMPGDIKFSRVLIDKKLFIEMYKFNTTEDIHEYYDKDGNNIRKKLMRTPIDGARLSSGFGNRRHPILGYNKMHKGVDFAAKKGTPIYAAGDGIIERANRYGGYGNYIRIRHNSEYKTAYAHLQKFAKGIKKGKYVRQGNTIGFVGTSGRSTGPHLHYEIIFNNKQVNPNKLKLPEGKKLDKNLFKKFNREKEKILLELKKLNVY